MRLRNIVLIGLGFAALSTTFLSQNNKDTTQLERSRYDCILDHWDVEHINASTDNLSECYTRSGIDEILQIDITNPLQRNRGRDFSRKTLEIFDEDTKKFDKKELETKNYFSMLQASQDIRNELAPKRSVSIDYSPGTIQKAKDFLSTLEENHLGESALYAHVLLDLQEYIMSGINGIEGYYHSWGITGEIQLDNVTVSVADNCPTIEWNEVKDRTNAELLANPHFANAESCKRDRKGYVENTRYEITMQSFEDNTASPDLIDLEQDRRYLLSELSIIQ
jgi:hypothetical protein